MSATVARPRTRLAVFALLGVTLVLTLSRAWRWPNDFAEAHWLLDYRFGFVKRGLAGQILASVLKVSRSEPTAAIISAIAVTLLIALAIALLWTAWQLMRNAANEDAATMAALAFLSSPFVVMSAHLTGYLDGLLLLLIMVAISLMLRGRFWAAGALGAIAVLVHESAVLVGFPMLCLAWWVTTSKAGSPGSRWARAVPLLLPVMAFAALALSAGRLHPDFQDLYSLQLQRYPFVAGDMHIFVPEWLTPGFAQHVAEQKHRFVERITSAPMLGLILPTVFGLLVWTVDACRVRVRSVTMVLLAGAIFAPQLMHVAAWDTMRIWTYSIVMAWLGAWILARSTGAPGGISSGVRVLLLLVLLVNVMAVTFLLDNVTDRYSLGMRLAIFSPVLATALVLFMRGEPAGKPS
jgi:hypothetical protein